MAVPPGAYVFAEADYMYGVGPLTLRGPDDYLSVVGLQIQRQAAAAVADRVRDQLTHHDHRLVQPPLIAKAPPDQHRANRMPCHRCSRGTQRKIEPSRQLTHRRHPLVCLPGTIRQERITLPLHQSR